MHATLLLSLFLAAAVQDPPPGGNLVANPGAESGDQRPDGWTKGNPVPGVRYRWDEEVAAEGRRSLSLHKTVDRYFPIAAWQQDVAHDGSARKLHFGALVRAANAHKALLDVAFLGADGKWTHAWAAYIGARGAGDPPADHDWQWYSGVVEVPAQTATLRFGLQVYGPGQVWFDRLRAVFVDDAVAATDAPRIGPQPAAAWGELPPQGAAAATDGPALRRIDDDPLRRFFVIPARGSARGAGHGLLVVLPGGDGSADFHPFVQRIAENAVPQDYVVAQAVAPEWSGTKDLVWPKRKDRAREVGKAAAEDFIAAIVEAVRADHRIDPGRVFLLGWSSGGPPCYAAAADPESPVRGALVAMSVFRRGDIGSLRGAKGRAFYVLHSPQDFIAMSFPERAVKDLAAAGAKTELATYEGGHGWHGDVYGNISAGVRWLEENTVRGRR